MDFWLRLDMLLSTSESVVDRPRGSAHPRYPETIYPLDYGYLVETTGGDGHEIDLWRGSLRDPIVTGVVCTVDCLKRDAEVKLLVGCTQAEADAVEEFYNSGDSMSAVVIHRPVVSTGSHVSRRSP